MKTLPLFLCLSLVSLSIMVVIDFLIGPKAEYLNAFSVLQRLLGIEPTVGLSEMARRFGAIGEFWIVIGANGFVGLILTLIAKLFMAK